MKLIKMPVCIFLIVFFFPLLKIQVSRVIWSLRHSLCNSEQMLHKCQSYESIVPSEALSLISETTEEWCICVGLKIK